VTVILDFIVPLSRLYSMELRGIASDGFLPALSHPAGVGP
jgi:hypothetical protein